MNKFSVWVLLFLTLIYSCKTGQLTKEPIVVETQEPVAVETKKAAVVPQPFLLGIEVLQQIDFAPLQGKKVGLVTNPTGVNRNLISTLDILHQSDKVNLVALFGPEHGVRGNFSAGDEVGNQTDEKTRLPVFSLYGKDKKPNREAKEMVDVMVYDIQDIGVRSYTYISTMG
ncbi:MAG: DUF1343 domain-containing protein, partial [Salinivirgaceae bacterium]|nr:DUF1343 domain-containing protein [Salinivirgaceae bacterium]